MNDDRKPRLHPDVVLRPETDDWALLYNPATGAVFGLHPVSVLICRLLDGAHTVEAILGEVKRLCRDVPVESESEVRLFIDDLRARGLALDAACDSP